MMVKAAAYRGAVTIPTDTLFKAPGLVPPWVDKYYTTARLADAVGADVDLTAKPLQLSDATPELGEFVTLSLADPWAPVIAEGNGDFILSDDEQPDPVGHMAVQRIGVDDTLLLSAPLGFGELGSLPIDSSELGAGLHTLYVKLKNTNNGTFAYELLAFEVAFTDTDYDGVQDRLDRWPEHTLYSDDGNANGIPDFADLLWGLSSASRSTWVFLDGVDAGYSYGEAIDNDWLFDWLDDDFDGYTDEEEASGRSDPMNPRDTPFTRRLHLYMRTIETAL